MPYRLNLAFTDEEGIRLAAWARSDGHIRVGPFITALVRREMPPFVVDTRTATQTDLFKEGAIDDSDTRKRNAGKRSRVPRRSRNAREVPEGVPHGTGIHY